MSAALRKEAKCDACGAFAIIPDESLSRNGDNMRRMCRPCIALERAERGEITRKHALSVASPARQCANCQRKATILKQGECDACYKYRKSHRGEARPARLYERERVTGVTNCLACGASAIYAGGRCKACYKWRWRHGVERPKERHAPLCRNPVCEKPLPKKGRHHTGLCDRCHEYHKLTGDLMPRKYVEASQWCDCGKRAMHRIDVPVACRIETYWLCEGCYRLEVGP